MQKPSKSNQLVLAVALATGLSIMGDSLMYSLLPLDAPNLGIALPLVGVLLSANRLVRLVSNTWSATLFKRYGARIPFLLSTVLGAVVALMYGVGWGFVIFLLARAGWGIAWSGLRQGGYDAVWRGDANIRGRMMGVLWGLVRLGSAISVILGGFLRDQWGYRVAAMSIAGLTFLAVPVALRINWGVNSHTTEDNFETEEAGNWKTLISVRVHRWVMGAGFMDGLFEGMLVSTASLFVTQKLGDASIAQFGIGVGTVAGLLLATRFTADLVFGPLLGALSDALGYTKNALLLSVVMLLALSGAVLVDGFSFLGFLGVAFISGAGIFVTLNAIASHRASASDAPHLFVGMFTTAGDSGMAAGPLLAYSLALILGLPALYLIGAGLLLFTTWQLWRLT